jgi:hypothetical protein
VLLSEAVIRESDRRQVFGANPPPFAVCGQALAVQIDPIDLRPLNSPGIAEAVGGMLVNNLPAYRVMAGPRGQSSGPPLASGHDFEPVQGADLISPLLSKPSENGEHNP